MVFLWCFQMIYGVNRWMVFAVFSYDLFIVFIDSFCGVVQRFPDAFQRFRAIRPERCVCILLGKTMPFLNCIAMYSLYYISWLFLSVLLFLTFYEYNVAEMLWLEYFTYLHILCSGSCSGLF